MPYLEPVVAPSKEHKKAEDYLFRERGREKEISSFPAPLPCKIPFHNEVRKVICGCLTINCIIQLLNESIAVYKLETSQNRKLRRETLEDTKLIFGITGNTKTGNYLKMRRNMECGTTTTTEKSQNEGQVGN